MLMGRMGIVLRRPVHRVAASEAIRPRRCVSIDVTLDYTVIIFVHGARPAAVGLAHNTNVTCCEGHALRDVMLIQLYPAQLDTNPKSAGPN
jgi:hypothetical protein